LLPLQLGTWVTSKFTRIWEFLSLPTTISERFDSKLANVGNSLVTQLSWYLCWPSVDLGAVKQGDQDRQLVWLPTKGSHVDKLNRGHLALCRLLWLRFYPCIFPSVVR
jgi:hypothetical protein